MSFSHSYSNGKLLISGEYLVLDGAVSLAVPTKFGQNLIVEENNSGIITWISFNEKQEPWFECEFDQYDFSFEKPQDIYQLPIAKAIQNILLQAKNLNKNFLQNSKGCFVKTELSFPRNWGLGTSSTLINNVAAWAKINPYDLLEVTFGGSGYDIACARNNSPILYQIEDNNPIVSQVKFSPAFKDQLYFIYLNQKMNSREGIKNYREQKGNLMDEIKLISELTLAILKADTIDLMEDFLSEHEDIISKITKQEKVQDRLFSDYFGQTKSLGAWGGDFILATGNSDTPTYFKNKGFDVVFPFEKIIL